jgi:hypothetical protein
MAHASAKILRTPASLRPESRRRMNTRHAVALVALFAVTAYNPFHRGPVSKVRRDANVNSRWRASLVSPAPVAGAMKMRGSASMQPRVGGQGTQLSVSVSNATPGVVHPWDVRRGQCGADEGVFSAIAAYKPLRIGDDGRGKSGTTVPGIMPKIGDFFVTVYASAANPETVVACGNLAPPAR